MIDVLTKSIKTNLAQFTELFDIESQDITVKTQGNRIFDISLSDGEWTFSNGTDSVSSKACINQTYDVSGNEIVTDCYFGTTETQSTIKAHKVRVGSAVTKDLAHIMIKDTKLGNSVVVYIDTATSTQRGNQYSISEDLDTNVTYTIGVIFKVTATDMENLGFNCIEADKLFISSVLGAKKNDASVIRFESVRSRFFTGNDYCAEYEFSYDDIMKINDKMAERMKHFDTIIGSFKL